MGVSASFSFSHLSPCFLVSLCTLNTILGMLVSTGILWMAQGLSSLCPFYVHAYTPFDTFLQMLDSRILLQPRIIESRSHQMQSGLSCAPSSRSVIRKQQSSCGSVHTVSTINHKHSQIAHRCGHAQECNHLKSWLHAHRGRDAFYNTNRKLYKHPHDQHACTTCV